METDYTEIDFSLLPDANPFYGPIWYDPAIPVPYWHSVEIDTDDFETGKLYFMRAYVQDNAHAFATDIPDDSQIYIMYYFTFRIE